MSFQKNDGNIYLSPVAFGPAQCDLRSAEGRPFEGVLSKVEQYVMAYRVEAASLQRILPEGFQSLRPVLRINVELLQNVAWLAGRDYNRIELNTPVAYHGKKGWLNLVTWENDCDSIIGGRDLHGIPKIFAQILIKEVGSTTRITAKSGNFIFLEMTFAKTGKEGGCPKEDDNEGTFHLRYMPKIGEKFTEAELLQTAFNPVEIIAENKEYCDCTFTWCQPNYAQMPFGYTMLQQISGIENEMVLGAYVVGFDRTNNFREQRIL